jgi:hypothetical protein
MKLIKKESFKREGLIIESYKSDKIRGSQAIIPFNIVNSENVEFENFHADFKSGSSFYSKFDNYSAFFDFFEGNRVIEWDLNILYNDIELSINGNTTNNIIEVTIPLKSKISAFDLLDYAERRVV